MKRTCRKRKKAFIGAIIGAVTSIAGSAIGAAAQKKAQNKQIARENEINRNQSANNLSNSYSNEEYINDFLNKTTFKYGGNKNMACGNRKTAEMGMYDKIKRDREIRRKQEAAFYEQKRRKANARRINAQKERATYITKLNAEAKKRQETKKRLSAKNTKPFPYNSPFVKNYANEPYNTPSSSTNRVTTTSTKRPTSPVTQTRTAVRRNTNTASIATRANTNVAKGSVRQNTTNKTNTPAKANTTTNRSAQRTAQRTTNASTQRPTTPARQTTDNKLTFSRAFASARRAGKQTFNWNGKSYTTQLAGEKKNNTNKIYNTATLNTRGVDVTETTKLPINTKTNTIPSSSSVIPKSNTLNIADNNGYYDRLKMMKCGGKRKMKCGGKCK